MTWAEQIHAARDAADAADATMEHVVRAAIADGASKADVAEWLCGNRDNRQRVYAILRRGRNARRPVPPSMPPVVYVRSHGCTFATLRRIEEVMWARGWTVAYDPTTPWHLAQGAVRVGYCDISTWDADGRDRADITVGVAVPPFDVVDGTPMDGHDLSNSPLLLVNRIDVPRPMIPGHGLDERRVAHLVGEALLTVSDVR